MTRRDEKTTGRAVAVREDPRAAARRSVESTRAAMEDLGIRGFSTEYRRLMRLVGADDFTSTQARQALVRAQLSMAINAMGQLDRDGLGVKAVYAMVSLSDHVRALTHDLHQLGDQAVLVERVRSDCVSPGLKALATTLVSQLTSMRSRMHRALPRQQARVVEGELREFQVSLASTFGEAQERMGDLVNRTLSTE